MEAFGNSVKGCIVKKTIALGIALATTCSLASFASAGPVYGNIPVVNPSFEVPSVGDAYPWYNGPGGPITGWNADPGTGVWNPFVYDAMTSTSQFTPLGLGQIAGQQVAYSNGGNISQTVTTLLQANTTYVLSVLVGDRIDAGNGEGGYGPADYSVGLYAGSSPTLLGQKSGQLAPGLGSFVTETVSYTSPGVGSPLIGEPLTIQIGSSGVQYDFDKVSLTAIPLPKSVWAGLGLLGFLGAYRLIRKQTESAFA
jgi:hypothetical protein